MTHDEMIAVIQAHKDGKVIQVKLKNDAPGRGWENLRAHDPIWHFGRNAYRPKPEPKEYWLVPYKYCVGYKVFSCPLSKLGKTDISNLELGGTIHVVTVDDQERIK
jgi:hypothetical protein